MNTADNALKARAAITALCLMTKGAVVETTLSLVANFSMDLMDACHNQSRSAGWWTDLSTGQSLSEPLVIQRSHSANIPAKLMLMVTELAEMFLGWQTASMDDHLPERRAVEVELADTVIRIADTAGGTWSPFAMAMIHAWQESYPVSDSGAANMMYVVTELAAAMEGYRKGSWDTKVGSVPLFHMSLARALIRCLGIANVYGLDLAGSVHDKLVYNAQRADHKLENRAAEGGKSV